MGVKFLHRKIPKISLRPVFCSRSLFRWAYCRGGLIRHAREKNCCIVGEKQLLANNAEKNILTSRNCPHHPPPPPKKNKIKNKKINKWSASKPMSQGRGYFQKDFGV